MKIYSNLNHGLKKLLYKDKKIVSIGMEEMKFVVNSNIIIT